jgi:hypothetical protein
MRKLIPKDARISVTRRPLSRTKGESTPTRYTAQVKREETTRKSTSAYNLIRLKLTDLDIENL